MNIKVCHITSAHPRYDGRIFEKQCKSLQKHGYDVNIICIDNGQDEIIDGIKIYSINYYFKSKISRLFKANRLLFEKAKEIDADIYQIHDPELLPLLLKLKRNGKKIVFDSHEDWISYISEISWIPIVFRSLIVLFVKIYFNCVLKKIDLVISVSPHIVDKYKKYTDRVFLITNYPIINQQIEFDRNKFLNGNMSICYVGTVYNMSNQESIISAVNKIDIDFKYNIIGVISPEFKNKLLKIDYKNKTNFIDKVPKDKLLELYSNSNAGIVIFDYHSNCGDKIGTLGNNKIFEYMYSGLPIICTNFDLWRTMIVEKYNCGICVEPGNEIQIEEAIRFIFNNKEKAYEMGQNGVKAVLDEFNWKTQEIELIKLYNKLCE